MNFLFFWKQFKKHWLYLLPLAFSSLFFWKLDGASFWFDELVTIRTVLDVNTRTFFLNFFSDQLHPPLYFAFLKFYFEILSFMNLLNQFLAVVFCTNFNFPFNIISTEIYSGFINSSILQKLEVANEFSIRLPSALFMTAANVLVFDFFKKKNLILVGLVTCFLIGTNTKLIYYAQEARPYALFVLMFILVLKEFGRVYNSELKLQNFKKLIIANSCLLLTHFYSVFVVGAEILIFTWMNRRNRNVVLSSVSIGAAFTIMFGGMYSYLNIAKFAFLRKFQFGDLLELHQNALGHFVKWPFVFYLSTAIAIKSYFKKFQESDRVYLAGAVFLAVFLTLIFTYTSYWRVYDERYLVLIIPLQILIITTINYSISEALLIFVKNRVIKNAGVALVFVMINIPQVASQPFFHFNVFDYYETEKYYPLRSAYESIVSDADFKESSYYVLEEYQGSYFGYYEKKYKVVQMANLNPDEARSTKENRLNTIVLAKAPQIFYFIRIRHSEVNQEVESVNVSGYSKKLLFLRPNAEAYKFTKEL